ncbi:hypothetical protein MKK75_06960 [Methylobacterium sp. J-030]|uniref:hypothetical protein n=1 Tax=Methylobacterium sp. J-030 TaxID=2836627 RepID=UPI001FB8DBF2|nr:hypothetical protein [Methylobacterium sp. J-030]MCJ2068546.1 hypothetical protein [Methylobacterium sp. J-030]
MPEPSLSQSATDASAVAEAAPSPAAFADAEPAAQAAPAELQGAPEAAPEAALPDSNAHAVLPREADPAAPEREFDEGPAPDLVPAPVAPRAAGASAPNRIVFAPDRIDAIEIGSTIARYVQGEGEAALAHFRALSDVRTPADLIRLQVGEVQRAADASLTCWVTVMGKASRAVAFR